MFNSGWLPCDSMLHHQVIETQLLFPHVNSTVKLYFFVETPTKLGTPSEREVICVSLKKDPKLGLGKLNSLCIYKMLFSKPARHN